MLALLAPIWRTLVHAAALCRQGIITIRDHSITLRDGIARGIDEFRKSDDRVGYVTDRLAYARNQVRGVINRVVSDTGQGRFGSRTARASIALGVLAVFVASVASVAVVSGGRDDNTSWKAMSPTSDLAPDALAYSADSPSSSVPPPASSEPTGGDPALPQVHSGNGEPAGGADENSNGGIELAQDIAPPPPPPPAEEVAPAPEPGTLPDWIATAIDIMQGEGIPVSHADSAAIETIILKESSGDPNAINLWDSNAMAGIPSKGLMQTIDPTFNAHKLPGYENIYAPVDNIIAGVRYTINRYGGFAGHPGLASMSSGGAYQGY